MGKLTQEKLIQPARRNRVLLEVSNFAFQKRVSHCTIMLAQAATNDRSQDLSKKQSAWAKPHSVLENLQGSVEKLSLTLNAVRFVCFFPEGPANEPRQPHL
jgi:hypothetical protein